MIRCPHEQMPPLCPPDDLQTKQERAIWRRGVNAGYQRGRISGMYTMALRCHILTWDNIPEDQTFEPPFNQDPTNRQMTSSTNRQI